MVGPSLCSPPLPLPPPPPFRKHARASSVGLVGMETQGQHSVGPEGGQQGWAARWATGRRRAAPVSHSSPSLVAPPESVESKEQETVCGCGGKGRGGERTGPGPAQGVHGLPPGLRALPCIARASPLLSQSSRTGFQRWDLRPQGSGWGGRKWRAQAQAEAGAVQTRPSGRRPRQLRGADPASLPGLGQAVVG